MTSIRAVTLEVADPTAADRFRTTAFGLGTRIRLRASEAPTGPLAKDAGVSSDGAGSHRLVIGGDAGPFTDPDGFAWETVPDDSMEGAL